MKLGSLVILCQTCEKPQEVNIHSVETNEKLETKIAYKCTCCGKTHFNLYTPKNKE